MKRPKIRNHLKICYLLHLKILRLNKRMKIKKKRIKVMKRQKNQVQQIMKSFQIKIRKINLQNARIIKRNLM